MIRFKLSWHRIPVFFVANSGHFFINWPGYHGGAYSCKAKLVLLYVFFLTEERLLSKPRNYNSPLYSVCPARFKFLLENLAILLKCNFFQTFTTSKGVVCRTLSNIYDEAFLQKWLPTERRWSFSQKTPSLM